MLTKFAVENFRGFGGRTTFDLKARSYEFNMHLIRNGVVKNALIYGKNGTGKSSLGLAIFDIIRHLTDKTQVSAMLLTPYLNLGNSEGVSSFSYDFAFTEGSVSYSYEKTGPDELCHESLWFDGRLVLDWNYLNSEGNFYDEKSLGRIDLSKRDPKVSVLKYVYRTLMGTGHVLLKRMMVFVENMLWYRSLLQGPDYAGYFNGVEQVPEEIVRRGKVKELESFLRENDLDYDLRPGILSGRPTIMAKFPSGKEGVFTSLASSGTIGLMLFFYWSVTAFPSVSLVFVDEFDAYIHYGSARSILERLNDANFQVILTTHNTYLMQNALTRPDACYIMTRNAITPLCLATEKEILQAHNLEKMYTHGVFRE